jgi:hypothetical protein
MKLTVKNIYGSSYGVNTLAGTVMIAPGKSIEDVEFSDAEAKNLMGNPKVFEVTGYVEPKGEAATDVAIDPGTQIANDKAKQTLADIVALFGTDEVDELNVKAAVERLIQDYDAMRSRSAGSLTADELAAFNSKPTDLAAAVALLDDANNDHWTQAGQPKISALESIMGKDVSAADYAALTDAQKRTRKPA